MLLTELPEGFDDLQVASGLDYPSDMEIAPDGDIYYLEKDNGEMRVIEDGVVRDEPVLSLDVSGSGERGLFSFTFDPGT